MGLQSPLGHVSLVALAGEDRKKLPGFIQETKILFVVDSIDAVYRKLEAAGLPILQPRTENIMGAQLAHILVTLQCGAMDRVRGGSTVITWAHGRRVIGCELTEGSGLAAE